MKILKYLIKLILSKTKYTIINKNVFHIRLKNQKPKGFSDEEWKLWLEIRPYTMTSFPKMIALKDSIEYIGRNHIKGDIVECGVWKGGSMMCAAKELLRNKSNYRNIYLYDTFMGMTEPTVNDVSFLGNEASELYNQRINIENSRSDWCYSSLDEVKLNMQSTGYPINKMIYVKGKVEDTIPKTVPTQIALLRLDTDWYQSTKHELEYLFPLLTPGGILIIDDYGHWLGSKRATDEFIYKNDLKIFLHRIDYSGRLIVKI